MKESNYQTFLLRQIEMVRQIKSGELTWSDLNRYRLENGLSEVGTDSLRRSFQQLISYDEEGWITPVVEGGMSLAPITERAVVNINFDKDETTSTKTVELTEAQLYDPEELMRAHGIDPEKFVIKQVNNAKVERYGLTGDTETYTSRITVRPKLTKDFTISDVDKYFDDFKDKKFKGLKITPTQYDPKGEFLEVDIADLHVGLLSHDQETGEDYDVYIARERLERAMSDVYERCKGRKFKRIVLALLGDIMHVDNQDNTTTKGTRQDTDTRVTKMFDESLDMMIDVIQNLGKIAPVEVIGITGNHSEVLDYCMYRAMEQCYKDDKNVTFFISPNPRKWRRYGKVLIGYGHGDLKVKNATEWLQGEASEDWGLSQFREVHFGHLHSLQTIQKIEDSVSGLITRYQPTLVASSAWEHKQGYSKNPKTMMSYVWNEDKGLREVWYSNI